VGDVFCTGPQRGGWSKGEGNSDEGVGIQSGEDREGAGVNPLCAPGKKRGGQRIGIYEKGWLAKKQAEGEYGGRQEQRKCGKSREGSPVWPTG